MSVLPVGIAASGDEGYTIEDSLRFRSSASAYLSRTFSTPTDNKKWTWSSWVKRGILSTASYSIFGQYTNSTNRSDLYFDANNKLNFYNYVSGSVSPSPQLITSQAFRDPSAWYHIVLVWDSNNATAADRQIIYVNGTRITSYQSSATVALGQSSQINSATGHTIGEFENVNVNFDGYLTEINFIDGQAIDPTDFGEFDEDTGVWKPKEYEGTYGTNGFYLDGSGVTDSSGNGNNWTNNNLNLTTSSATTYDLMNDVPTLTDEDTANFCTLNPLDTTLSYTPTDGNLKVTLGGTVPRNKVGTIAVSSGKWYWEALYSGNGSSTSYRNALGVVSVDTKDTYFTSADGVSYSGVNGYSWVDGTGSAYGATTTSTGGVFAVALNLDDDEITFYINNVSQGTITSKAFTGAYLPSFSHGSSVLSTTWEVNFGQRPFAYTPPTGFKSLNTYNLPDSTIEDGSEHFNTVLYTGDGTTSRSITGVGFQPDFVWGKERNGVAHHTLVDAVRGLVTGGRLSSNRTNAEDNFSNATLDSFDSDGFTTGSSTNIFNTSGRTFVAWNWKANGSGVLNEVGDINSTVSANTTSGFSIVSYTGTGSASTVGHGLGVAPSMIIFKNRDGAYDWATYHKDLTSAAYTVYLSLNYAQSTNSTVANYYNSTAPTSSVFSIGASNNYTNLSSNKYIAYCFADIEGFSSFGSYTGNGSTDGPFIYTGFRPSWLMVKTSTYASTNWLIFDSARSPYNAVELELNANNNNQEYDNNRDVDFLSNGFKIRSGTNNNFNTSGGNYIYAAFAENPFKNSLAR